MNFIHEPVILDFKTLQISIRVHTVIGRFSKISQFKPCGNTTIYETCICIQNGIIDIVDDIVLKRVGYT